MIAWRDCVTATRWGCDQCKYHVWITNKILPQFDVIHGLMVAEIDRWSGC